MPKDLLHHLSGNMGLALRLHNAGGSAEWHLAKDNVVMQGPPPYAGDSSFLFAYCLFPLFAPKYI